MTMNPSVTLRHADAAPRTDRPDSGSIAAKHQHVTRLLEHYREISAAPGVNLDQTDAVLTKVSALVWEIAQTEAHDLADLLSKVELLASECHDPGDIVHALAQSLCHDLRRVLICLQSS